MVLNEFQVCFRTFFEKLKKILDKIRLFLTNLVVHKSIKREKKIGRQYFHNILRLFDVLPDFPFTTSETNVDYYL